MSRVEKHGRLFRPLKKGSASISRPGQPSQNSGSPPHGPPQPAQAVLDPPQVACSSLARITSPLLSSTPPLSPPTPTQSIPSSPRVPLTASNLPGLPPPSSAPITVPDGSQTMPETGAAHANPWRPQRPHSLVRASSVMSATSSIGSTMSAADKMKAKARAAKAARAEAKLQNPGPSRRSSSVAPPDQPEDILVPTPLSDGSGNVHAITQIIQASLRDANDLSVQPVANTVQDILVHCGSAPSRLSSATPTLDSTVPNEADEASKRNTNPETRQSEKAAQPMSEETSAAPKKKARATRKPRAILPNKKSVPSLQDNEDEDEISPRMRRKRHLSKLRAGKRTQNVEPASSPASAAPRQRATTKLFIDSSGASGDDDEAQDENFEASDAEVEEEDQGVPKTQKKALRIKGLKRPRPRIKTSKLKIKSVDPNSEEEDENATIDPTTMTLNILCAPDAARGRRSQALENRMKLVIERKNREKAERMMLRAEQKKRKRRALAERREISEDSQTMRAEDEQGEASEQRDEVEGAAVGSSAPVATAVARKSCAESYDPEDFDSDEDMENFEEVIFDEFATSSRTQKKDSASKAPAAPLADIEEEEEVEEVFEEDYVPEARQYAPQLRVVDGQIVLDQDSLQVDRQENQGDRLDEMEIVEENEATRLVNSSTWSRKVRGERWTAEETALFFDAVRMFGSDFEMIAQLFPGRQRKQIRLKWIKEEKKAPDLMTDVMMGRNPARAPSISVPPSPIDEEPDDQEGSEIVELTSLTRFEEYAKLVGIDCSGPVPVDPMDKWREKERLEDEKLRKQAADALEKTSEGDEDEEEEVIEEDFNTAGWGELD